MESTNGMIHKTANDYAIKKKHPEIVELLSKGPSQAYKLLVERNKKLHRENLNQKKKKRNTKP